MRRSRADASTGRRVNGVAFTPVTALTTLPAGRIVSAMRNTIVALGMLLSGLGNLAGQTSTGGLSGTVSDPAGAVVAGARLVLINLETNDSRRGASNEIGFYSFPALPAGRYKVEVEHAGFKRFVQEPIPIQVQQFVTLDPRLEVGQSTQTVEVTGQATLLDAQTSSLSQVV